MNQQLGQRGGWLMLACAAGRGEDDPVAAELWLALRDMQIVESEGTSIVPDAMEVAADAILRRRCET